MTLEGFPDVLDAGDFASIFRISTHRVKKMVLNGMLPGTVLPDGSIRILRATAQAWLDDAKLARARPSSGSVLPTHSGEIPHV